MLYRDAYNDWAHIGTTYLSCKQHNDNFSPPSWGITAGLNNIHKGHIYCCRKQNIARNFYFCVKICKCNCDVIYADALYWA